MNEAIKDFFLYIISERILSKNTVLSYKIDSSKLIRFLRKRRINDFSNVQEKNLIEFLEYLYDKNYSSSTRSRILGFTKSLFRFLKREGIVFENPAKFIPYPKIDQKLPQILSVEEVEELLNAPKPFNLIETRDKAILELLYSSGLRVSELCELKISCLKDDFLRVNGKGGKERLVPVGRHAIKAIENYLNSYRRPFNSPREPLFLSVRQTFLNRCVVWKIVKLYASKVPIFKNVFPHTLRHCFATHLLNNKADIRIIQELMGHSDINTTGRYTQISRRELIEAFYAYHPRP